MKAPLQYAKLKCVSSLGPLPDYRNFKVKEQVLVEFASGYKTLGTIIRMPMGIQKPGTKTTLYVYFKDKRYSHCRPLGGQECQCFETGARIRKKDWQPNSCPLHGVFLTQPAQRRPQHAKNQKPSMPLQVCGVNLAAIPHPANPPPAAPGTSGIQPLGNLILSPMKDDEDPLW